MEFREGAIYQLPNGRELVAQVSKNTTVLHNLSASYAGQYELNDEGRFVSRYVGGRLSQTAVLSL
jgi:hypothetical protein